MDEKSSRLLNGIVTDIYDGGEDDEEYDEYCDERERGVIFEDENGVVRGVLGGNGAAGGDGGVEFNQNDENDDDDNDLDDFRVKPTTDDEMAMPVNTNYHNNFVDDADMGNSHFLSINPN